MIELVRRPLRPLIPDRSPRTVDRRAVAVRVAITLACALTLGGPAATAAPPAPANAARSWEIESFEARITVLRSGDIVVTETIRPRFEGSYNGIYRTIPIDYRTPMGFAYKLRLDVESVTDERGNELRREIGRENGHLEIKVWIPGAVDATKTVVLRYRVKRALRHFEADSEREGIAEAYDELYWNVTGTEWPVPIGSARATVELPVEAAGIRAHAFTGAYGSVAQDADVLIEGSLVRFATRGSLGFREGLTVGVAWDAGVVERPSSLDEVRYFLGANWPLALPGLAFFAMFSAWRRRGKDPKIGSIEPRYEPPEGLTPAEVGVVADNSADMRDITATLVDLAVRGYLIIEEKEEKKLLGLVTDRDYVYHLRRDRASWEELQPHERKLLRAVFARSRDVVELSDLRNKFYKHLPDLKDRLMDSLVEHRVYARRPDHVAGRYIALAIAVGVAIVGLGLGGATRFGLATLPVIIGGVLTALVIGGFGLIMPARTREGARLFRLVRGFEEFLSRVESDRFKRMITGPEQFEALLPFAMALGVEDRWASAFDDMYREPPEWYRGSSYHHFNTHLFVSDLGRMTGQTANVMRSAPRSSGGSSFGGGGGGGGFSGGGFGGGGGGAF